MKHCLVPGLLALLIAAGPSGAAAAGAGSRPRLVVCVDADNPPFSSDQDGGIDVDIARAVAERLQRELALHWVRVPERGGLGKALKASIQAGQCDVFMGLPEEAEMASELAERKLAVSRRYLTVGYVAVSGSGGGTKVGAVTATPADVYLHRQQTAERVPYGSNRELLEALRAGQLKSALIWSPALAGQLAADGNTALRIEARQPADPSLRFGLLAAVRTDGAIPVADLDHALDALASAGKLGAIAGAHALPPL